MRRAYLQFRLKTLLGIVLVFGLFSGWWVNHLTISRSMIVGKWKVEPKLEWIEAEKIKNQALDTMFGTLNLREDGYYHLDVCGHERYIIAFGTWQIDRIVGTSVLISITDYHLNALPKPVSIRLVVQDKDHLILMWDEPLTCTRIRQ
jgi:hypothetical protein